MFDLQLESISVLCVVASVILGALGVAFASRRHLASKMRSFNESCILASATKDNKNKKMLMSSQCNSDNEIQQFVMNHIAKTGKEPGPELLAHLKSHVKRERQAVALAVLSAREREEEMLVRQEQLAAMASLMSQKPEQFGCVSFAEVNSQLSAFYA